MSRYSLYALGGLLGTASFFVAAACATKTPIAILEAGSPQISSKYSYRIVGTVRAKCTKSRGEEVTAKTCIEKLQKRASRVDADAIVVEPPILVQTGVHEGLEIIAVECQGSAIVWTRSGESDP